MATERPTGEEAPKQTIHLSPRTYRSAELLADYLRMKPLEAISKAIKTLLVMTDALQLGERWISDTTSGTFDIDVDAILRRPVTRLSIPQDALFTDMMFHIPTAVLAKLKPLALTYNMTLEELLLAGFQLTADIRERYLNRDMITLVGTNGTEREIVFFTDADDDRPLY